MQKVFIQLETDDAPAFAQGIGLKRQKKSLNGASSPNGNEPFKMCMMCRAVGIRGDYEGYLPYHPVFTRREVLILYAVD